MQKRMRYNKIWLMIVALLGLALTGCSDDYMDEIIRNQDQKEQNKDEQQEDSINVNAEYEEMVEFLNKIPGISGAKYTFDNEAKVIYCLYYDQQIDHKKPELGTFKQRIILRYVGMDAPVVLLTDGYDLCYIHPHLSKYINANTVEVEHRYFKESTPEPLDEAHLDFNYLYTDQAAADLHDIVQLMKKHMFKTGKWLSTGTSKSGITTGLYAYYSDLNGWHDIDLFMPFCAPFLPCTPDRSRDFSVGKYLTYECGSKYPKGSKEAIAYERLKKIPYAITTNKNLREACMRRFYLAEPNSYLEALNEYGKSEIDATCCIVYTFYSNLFPRYSYCLFSKWADLVPDPDEIGDGDEVDEEAMENLVDFIFMDFNSFVKYVDSRTNTDEYIQYNQYNTAKIPYIYNDEQLYNAFASTTANVYYIQALRELGAPCFDFSLVNSNYVEPAYIQKIVEIFETETLYNRYAGQWDGGKLMTNFLNWVYTESSAPIVFVYAADDPWTGGGIDDEAAEKNALVKKIVTPGGIHTSNFLDNTIFTEDASNAIKSAIKEYLGL